MCGFTVPRYLATRLRRAVAPALIAFERAVCSLIISSILRVDLAASLPRRPLTTHARLSPGTKYCEFFAGLPQCTVGVEARAGAHHWTRELQGSGTLRD
jgi:hypothetical protein